MRFRPRWRWAIAAVIAGMVCAAIALAAPGDRDPQYGTSGSVLYAQGNVGTSYRDMVVHPDGGVVAAGRSSYTTAGGGLSPLIVVRHTEQGPVDTSWGNRPEPINFVDYRGSFKLVGDSGTEAHQVGLDAQKRVYVAAETGTGGLMILRLTPAGQLDTTYNGDGKSPVIAIDDDIDITGMGVSAGGGVTLALNHVTTGARTNGEILQFTNLGELDASFDSDGRLTRTDVTISDLLVDGAGQIAYVNGGLGGDPEAPSVNSSLRRLTTTGVPDTSFNTTGTVTLPVEMRPRLAKIVRDPLGDIYVGEVAPTTGGVNFLVAKVATDGTLSMNYGGAGFDHGTAFLPEVSAPAIRGMALTSDRRAVIVARVTGPNGVSLALGRFRDTGVGDASFRTAAAGDVRFAIVDQLGLPGTTAVDPLAGVLRVAEDKMLVGGSANANAGTDHAFVARYGTPGLPPTVELFVRYPTFGDGRLRDYARPGPVKFTALGADPEGTAVTYEWSVDGGAYQLGEPQFEPTLGVGDHVITVRVRDEDGQDITAAIDAKVIANEAPTGEFSAGHDTYDPVGIPAKLDEDRVVIFKYTGTDDAGDIARVQWNLDGDAGFEKEGLRTYMVFPTTGQKTVSMIVTDMEGKTTLVTKTLTLVNPPCADTRTLEIGRLRATSPCWNKKVENGVTTWKATRPPPPPPPGEFQLADPLLLVEDGSLPPLNLAPVTINGISFLGYDSLEITQRSGSKQATIKFTGARVAASSTAGTPFLIRTGGSDSWTYDESFQSISGVNLPQGSTFGGLRVNELAEDIAIPEAGKARLRFYPRLPAQLGGMAVDDIVVINTRGFGAAVTARAAAATQSNLECIDADDAQIPGLDFLSGTGMKICRDPEDADHWRAEVKLNLAEFIGGVFEAPSLSATVEIDGDSVEVHGAADFGANFLMVPPVIYLNQINFDLVLNPKPETVATSKLPGSSSKAKCVPFWDKDRVSLQPLRDLLLAEGVARAKVYAAIPDIVVDHGIPKTTVCGGIKFSVKVAALELADGSVSLGVADYPDRPDAFRAVGRVNVLDTFGADAKFAVYSNGYSDMSVDIDKITFFDVVSLDGGVRVQVDVADLRYEALAWIEGCVIPVDFCSGIKGMISSRGIGGCLGLYFLGGEWEPGAVYRYSDGLTPYFSGCDLSEIEVDFEGKGSSFITYELVEPRTAYASTSAFRKQVAGSALRTLQAAAKTEQDIVVEDGLPGLYVAVRGKDKQLARFTLTGPKGERITADGRQDGTPTKGKDLIVGHDAKTGVTHVMLGAPSRGVWKLRPSEGSVPISDVWSAEGLDKPKITARVRGKGRRRALDYSVQARKGQTVRFEERGTTGKQLLGDTKEAKGSLRFTTAPGQREKREIVALVSQDGLPRDEQVVATYRSPSIIPSRVGRLLVKRAGKRVTLKWLAATSAEEYLITGTLSDGRVIRKEIKGRRLVLPRVAKGTTGKLSVVALNELGQKGKATKRKLAKKKKRKARKG